MLAFSNGLFWCCCCCGCFCCCCCCCCCCWRGAGDMETLLEDKTLSGRSSSRPTLPTLLTLPPLT